ncbi:hypothetical protein C8R44DRAFT_728382 [Mycena epipterygia]|nr:hypothetical protein C8R44DRAFT_728382 [Mycena epipterygia]
MSIAAGAHATRTAAAAARWIARSDECVKGGIVRNNEHVGGGFGRSNERVEGGLGAVTSTSRVGSRAATSVTSAARQDREQRRVRGRAGAGAAMSAWSNERDCSMAGSHVATSASRAGSHAATSTTAGSGGTRTHAEAGPAGAGRRERGMRKQGRRERGAWKQSGRVQDQAHRRGPRQLEVGRVGGGARNGGGPEQARGMVGRSGRRGWGALNEERRPVRGRDAALIGRLYLLGAHVLDCGSRMPSMLDIDRVDRSSGQSEKGRCRGATYKLEQQTGPSPTLYGLPKSFAIDLWAVAQTFHVIPTY